MPNVTLDVIQTKSPDLYAKIRRLQEKMPDEIFAMEDLCDGIPGVTFGATFLPEEVSGMIFKNSDDDFTIWVNDTERKPRQRFTAAHELAHYILHREQMGRGAFRENTLLRGGLSNAQETEANQLAAEILMPYDKLFAYMDRYPTKSMQELARHFRVSPSAMMIRLGIPG